MLYVTLALENVLTVDALVDSAAYVSAIAQTELNNKLPPTSSNTTTPPPNFQILVANGQLEKQTQTTKLKFDIGDNTFDEHVVVMKNLTGPNIGLHLMKHNSVVIDNTRGFIHFLHLTMQTKNATIETSAKQLVLIQDSLAVPPMTTKTITALVDHPPE